MRINSTTVTAFAIILSALFIVSSFTTGTMQQTYGKTQPLLAVTDSTISSRGNETMDIPVNPQEIWNVNVVNMPEPKSNMWTSPVVANGNIYLASPDYYIYSVNGSTGKVNWQYYMSQKMNADPVIVGNTIYAVTINEGRLLSLTDDEQNPIFNWNLTVGNVKYALSASSDYVVTVNSNGQAFIISPTGTVLHTVNVHQRSNSPPVIDGNSVYIVNSTGTVFKIDALSGSVTWTADTNAGGYGGIKLLDGAVYYGGSGGYFACLNASNGNILWSTTFPGDISSTPAVMGDVVYVVAGSTLYAITRSGTAAKVIDTYTIGAEVINDLVAVSSGVLVYDKGGNLALYSLNNSTLERVWTHKTTIVTTSVRYSSPAVGLIDADGNNSTPMTPCIAVASEDGYLHVYSDLPNLWGSSTDISIDDTDGIYIGETVDIEVTVRNSGLIGTWASVALGAAYPWVDIGSKNVFVPARGMTSVSFTWHVSVQGDQIFIQVQTRPLYLPESNSTDSDYYKVISLAPPASIVWPTTIGQNYGGNSNPESPLVGTNKTAWEIQTQSDFQPLAYQGRIILTRASGTINCIMSYDGSPYWSVNLDNLIGSDVHISAPPIIYYDKVFVAYSGANKSGVLALSIASGDTVWSVSTTEATYLNYGDGGVFVMTATGIYLLDGDHGKQVSFIPVSNGLDFVFSQDNETLVVRTTDGLSIIPQNGAPIKIAGNVTEYAIDNTTGTLIVSNSTGLSGLALNGSVRWKSSPVYAFALMGNGDVVYDKVDGLFVGEAVSGNVLTTVYTSFVPQTIETLNNGIYMMSASGISAWEFNSGEIKKDWVLNYSSLSHNITYATASEGKIFLQGDGKMTAVGTINHKPDASIVSPINGSYFLLSQTITLNASGSSDPDGDSLTYTWTSSLDGVLGAGEYISVMLSAGEHNITVEVSDGMGGLDYDTITIFVLKPKTTLVENESIPLPYRPSMKVMYAGDLTYRISDIPAIDAPALNRGMHGTGHYFRISVSALALGWMNISIGYSTDDVLPGIREDNLRLYNYNGSSWNMVPGGFLQAQKRVWGNSTVMGIFTVATMALNSEPVLEDCSVDPTIGISDTTYIFNTTYSDIDNDAPEFIRVVIDNNMSYTMSYISGSNATGALYSVKVTGLSIGMHYFYVETSDGTTTVRSRPYTGPDVVFHDRPPQPMINITGFQSMDGDVYVVQAGHEITFDASGTTDPDSTHLDFYWDFINNDTHSTSSKIGPVVKKIFTKAGSYTVRLTVCDGTNNISMELKLHVEGSVSSPTGPAESADNSTLIAIILLLIVVLAGYIWYYYRNRAMEERIKADFFIDSEEEPESKSPESQVDSKDALKEMAKKKKPRKKKKGKAKTAVKQDKDEKSEEPEETIFEGQYVPAESLDELESIGSMDELESSESVDNLESVGTMDDLETVDMDAVGEDESVSEETTEDNEEALEVDAEYTDEDKDEDNNEDVQEDLEDSEDINIED